MHTPQRLIVLLAALVAFGPLSIDMYLPSLPAIAADLSAQAAQVQMTIGVFLAGLSVGMLLIGPLSDRFGRRRLLLGGIVLYVLATLGCVLAAEVDQLIVWRFIQALGGAAAAVLARAIVRDVFALQAAAKVLSLMHVVTMLAALVAPLLGGYVMQVAGWRVLFIVLMLFAGLCLVAVTWWIPETHPPAQRRASLSDAFKAYAHMAVQPVAIGYILCMGLCFAGMFAFITASPFIYINYFQVSSLGYAYLFALNIVGIILATVLNSYLVMRVGIERMLSIGAMTAALAGFSLALTTFIGAGGLPTVVIGVLCYVSVTGLLGANCLARLLALYPRQAGAAAGLAIAMQFALGTVCSALVSVFYNGTAWPMSLLMAFTGIGSLLALQLARRSVAQSHCEAVQQ